MGLIFLVSRILFVYLFIMSGIGHLTQTEAMAGYAGSKGVPSPKAATVVSGAMIVIGGVLVLLGIWGDLGALLLALFVIPTAFIMHGFWKETDPMTRQTEMISFNKDLALGGAALAFLVLFAYIPGSELWAITNGLFF